MNNKSFLAKAKEVSGKAGPIAALLLLGIFLSIASPNFLTVTNLLNVARQVPVNGFLALGMMACILTAGIDLSVGYTMALSSIVMAFCAVKLNIPPVLCLLLGIITGAVLGTINGLLLTRFRLPHPFISTMGTKNIYKGIGLLITGATPIAGMPLVVKWAGSSFLSNDATTFMGKVPVSFILMIIVYVLFSIFLNYTTLGRHIYAVGGNITTAGLSGINVNFVRTSVYAISGLMASFAAIINLGRTDAAAPLAGENLDNDAIAAVIIGGTSFFGGKGNVLGTLSGVLLIAVLRNGMNLLNASADIQTIILGGIIILAVFIDVVRNGGFAKVKRLKKKDETPSAAA